MTRLDTNLAENDADSGENLEIPSYFQDFYSRLEDRLGGKKIVTALAPWITKHTRLDDKPFSFNEHEFQIAIANDTAEEGVVKKCSQVGLSELSVRITLALLAVSDGRSAIYVLPSAKFGAEFSKARISPVIDHSDALKRLLIAGSNGAMMKRFGNSILYIGGAANEKQAISRPADALIVDEYDFCDMAVMTKYNSRLRHSRHKYKRFFSTPTVNNYGVSKKYDESDMKVYFVKCSRCGERQPVDWNTQVFIPGFTQEGRDFTKFEKEDILNEDYDIDGAYVACIKCESSLNADLANPALREWVARIPSRKISGYHVRPIDLITYNPVHDIIRQMSGYERMQDYWNFVLGETYASDENQINETVYKNSIRATPISPEEAKGMNLQGYYMGIDVGKTCHYMIGRPIEGGRIEVVWFGKLRMSDGPLKQQIVAVYNAYNCYRGVIDAAPDFSLGQSVREDLGEWFQPAQYVRGGERKPSYFEYEEDKDEAGVGTIALYRTKGFDSMVSQANKGKWSWPKVEEAEKELLEHMRAMKRIDVATEDGERKPKWVKVNDMDHYLHAAMYLKTAIDQDNPIGASVVVASPTIITGASLGGALRIASEMGQRGDDRLITQNTLSKLVRVFGLR